MKYYLGIDIGTSGTKGVCFDEDGHQVTSKLVTYDLETPKPGYAEQNPEDWVQAAKMVIQKISKEGYRISGIGLSGQMHGLVLLDKEDKLLRKSIIWCDNRAILEAEELIRHFGNEKMKAITGNDVVASFTLSKLLWVKNHEPEIYRKISKIMLPKDYVRYCLTGAFTTEYSDASGMQLVNIYEKRYSKELLDYLEITENMLPKLKESSDISGYLTSQIAEEVGLTPATFVVGGAGDQAAAAIGNGIIERGDVSVVLGSSGVVFSPILKEDLADNQVQVFMHAVPDTYHIMGVTNGCGLSYKWLKETLFEDKEYKELNDLAEAIPPSSNGLIYLPYLNGERTPHMDPFASGTFIGIRQNTTAGHMVRAVLEGVAYSLKDCFSLLPKARYHIRISGGGAKGGLWRTIIASCFHEPVERIQQAEGGALGVAILAMVADGVYPSIKVATSKIIQPSGITYPKEEWVMEYEKGHQLYQDAYFSLKKFYEQAFKIEEEKE